MRREPSSTLLQSTLNHRRMNRLHRPWESAPSLGNPQKGEGEPWFLSTALLLYPSWHLLDVDRVQQVLQVDFRTSDGLKDLKDLKVSDFARAFQTRCRINGSSKQ